MTEPGKTIDVNAPARPKVLVADDEANIASLIEDCLSERYEVSIALNGKTAVQKAIWHRPLLILLDIVMPDMGGYEVVRLLQAAPQTEAIPVIIMTAKNFDDSTVKMIQAEKNVRGFIIKPFKPTDLLKMIEAVAAGKRMFSVAAASPSSGAAASAPRVAIPLSSLGPQTTAPPAPPTRGPAPLVEDPAPMGSLPRGTTVDIALEQRAVDRSTGVPDPARMPPVRTAAAPSSPIEYGGKPRSWPARLLLRLLRWSGIMALPLIGLWGVGEWTTRSVERQLGRRLFVPPVFPASTFNPFLPYQWTNLKQPPPWFWNDGRVVYQFNEWGLRGPGFPLLAPPGTTRVLLVGGTFAFGPGLDEEKTIAHRLESVLNRSRPGAYQVINAGLWGLSAQEQWDYVNGQGFNFKPQRIIWLAEAREPGAPSTDGLHRLASLRWLLEGPLGKSRFFCLGVARLIQGSGDPPLSAESPLFKTAQESARARGVPLEYWVVTRGPVSRPSASLGRVLPVPLQGEAALHNAVAEQIAGFVSPPATPQSPGQK